MKQPAAFRWRRAGLLGGALALALWLLPHSAALFHAGFPELSHPLYTRTSLLALTLAHLGLVALASALAIAVGLSLGIAATRPAARALLPTVQAIAVIGQTLPPVAVLALAVPLLGFGGPPTLLALGLYGVLPVLGQTVAGLLNVSPELREAAAGMGYTAAGRLRELELPLALGQIMAGVRISVIVSIGTATVGSTVGASTLGAPIIEGLVANNTAYVIQGVLLVGLLALWIDALLGLLQEALWRRASHPGAGPRIGWRGKNRDDADERRTSAAASTQRNIQARTDRQPPSSLAVSPSTGHAPSLLLVGMLAGLGLAASPSTSAAARIEAPWHIESFCHRPIDPARRCLVRARQGIITLNVAQLPSAPSVRWQDDIAVLQSRDGRGSQWRFLIPPQQLSIAYRDVLALQAPRRLLAYRDGAVVHLVELFKSIGRHDWLTLPDDTRIDSVRASFDGERLEVRWSDTDRRAHQQSLRLPTLNDSAR